MSSSRDPTARLRAGLNPLLTASLGGYHGHHANTPLSAVSMTSHAFSSNQTPLSAIQPYNPQEWVASPAIGPGSDRTMQQFPPPQGHPYLEPQGNNPSTSTPIFTSPQRKADEYGARAVSRCEHIRSPSSTTAGTPSSTASHRAATCNRVVSTTSWHERIVKRKAVWVSVIEQTTRTTDKHSCRRSSTGPTPRAHVSRYEWERELAEAFDVANTTARTNGEPGPSGTKSSINACHCYADISQIPVVITGAMGSEILDLTRDLFRPMDTHNRRESSNSATSGVIELTTPQSSEPRSHRGSIGSVFSGNPNSHGQTPITPSSASQPMTPGSSGNTPNANNWPTSNYMPSLSPILSMSVSDAVDEQDSRGRPASRWWEADSSGAPSMKMERSKRESKYMGVPKEAREALQWIDDGSAGPSNNQRYSDSEYPPEKVGWHEPDQTTPAPQQQQSARNSVLSNYSSPSTPNPAHLDVSRLVTLPPPYPRHHPAVNNNHPELTQTRSTVRVISDMTEIDAIKEKFKLASTKARTDAAEAAKQRRATLRQNLQSEIASGSIGYAEAAAIETDANTSENSRIQDLEKSDFDEFQTAVVVPVNEILQTRITKATELFDSLRSRLFDETHDSNPNLPQEEGDEQPELLEKLTLLKWIFEARETLHRALYDLLSDRNDRYREVVLTPYRLVQGQQDKIASATAFFAEDAAKRALAYHEEVLHRTQQFRDVVEETVIRGVEAQLSAFWDIAPPLKRLLDNIPASMEGFQIQIPQSEYEENPSYVEHPLQYLFSLLLHAEKSTYQFIESQTNLLCLLHEVKEACVSAKAKVMESDGRDASRVEQMRVEEGQRLTEDLKEKVRVVQDQWNEALGETIGGVKERVGGWLLETGGWDESLEDGGVGGV
ncbi:hypothetical protein B0T13DRAFT_429083 [Neurospora crassa]|nr:hypothetical protein B0T13DRAFT_429083 [Neurospora crassa]